MDTPKLIQQVQLQDVYIFEKTLKESVERVQNVRREYKIILWTLFALNGFAVGNLIWVYFNGDQITLNIYAPVLAGGCCALYFVHSDLYKRRIIYADNYVERCNRALKKYNIRYSEKYGKLMLLTSAKSKEPQPKDPNMKST